MTQQKIEAIFELTPVQEGLLFHSIANRSNDPGFTQVTMTIHGDLDATALEKAWSSVVNRHSALRTSIQWEGLDRPLNVVQKHVEPVFVDGFSRSDDCRRDQSVTDFLSADRKLGFDLNRAPLGRLAILPTDDGSSLLVFSIHHIIADGWSASILADQLFANYSDNLSGTITANRRSSSFLTYSRWLKSVDTADAEDFWTRHLGQLRSPTTISRFPTSETQTDLRRSREERVGGTEFRERLQSAAVNTGVTQSVLVLGAWSLVLAEATGKSRVLFGMTTAGRPADIPDVASIVGPFSRTIPLVVDVDKELRVVDWLLTLQRNAQSASEFSFLSDEAIVNCSRVSDGTRLFDTVVAAQNYPMPDAHSDTLKITDSSGEISTVLPITLNYNSDLLSTRFFYDGSVVEKSFVAQIQAQFAQYLELIVSGADGSVREITLPMTPLHVGVYSKPGGAPNGTAAEQRSATPPTNPTEARLVDLWRRLLLVQTVGIDSNFFDLGGNSLMAVRLSKAIEEEFERRVQTIAIAMFPTIREFAAQTLEAEPSSANGHVSDTILRLSDGDSRERALFGVYTPGGDAIVFADLARAFDGRRTVYALQPVGVDRETEPISDMLKMAEVAIEDILRVQTEGPYHLVSICGGGLPYEVARQLMLRGLEVGVVVVVDPGWISLPLEKERLPSDAMVSNVSRSLKVLRSGKFVAKVRQFFAMRWKQYDSKRRATKQLDQLEPDHRRLVEAYYRASNVYYPEASDVSMKFLLTQEWRKKPDLNDRLSRWREIARGGIAVREFGAVHDTVFHGESATDLADIVEDLIAEYAAQSPQHASTTTALLTRQ